MNGKEPQVLCTLLDQADLPYSAMDDHILIPFELHDSELIEDGTQVSLYGVWGPNLISILVPLMELYEDEQLDPYLAQLLMIANYQMDICKFGIGPFGLSLLVDFDARNLQCEEIESGIISLLLGVETYCSALEHWFEVVAASADGYQLLTDDQQFLVVDPSDPAFDAGTYQQQVVDWVSSSQRKGAVSRALLGIAKFGLKAAALGGLAVLLGVPPMGIAGMLTAIGRPQ
jgi:hypothetical protein